MFLSEALIANTLRKHKPLFLCTYIYVSLTFIVFCKTTSRNLHTWHFKSQERRTRHSARIEPKKKHVNSVFNHARYSKVIQQWIPLSGFWVLDSGFLVRETWISAALGPKLNWCSYKNTSASAAVCLKRARTKTTRGELLGILGDLKNYVIII